MRKLGSNWGSDKCLGQQCSCFLKDTVTEYKGNITGTVLWTCHGVRTSIHGNITVILLQPWTYKWRSRCSRGCEECDLSPDWQSRLLYLGPKSVWTAYLQFSFICHFISLCLQHMVEWEKKISFCTKVDTVCGALKMEMSRTESKKETGHTLGWQNAKSTVCKKQNS